MVVLGISLSLTNPDVLPFSFSLLSIGDSREHQYVLYEPFCIFVLGFMIWASSLFTLGIKFLI